MFVLFIKRRWEESKIIELIDNYKLAVYIIIFLIIQCVAGNYFTGSDSLPIMIMVGLLLSKKREYVYYGNYFI